MLLEDHSDHWPVDFVFHQRQHVMFLPVYPFEHPGVESYNKNMFALLGKKGYDELSKELNERLKK